MTHATEVSTAVWTAVDLVERLGPIPLDRVRTTPPPGSATEHDVIEIHDHENRLCELLDGTLVEKTMGSFESYLAMDLGRVLATFVRDHDLGIVLGADGWYGWPTGWCESPRGVHLLGAAARSTLSSNDIWRLAPDLAVEVD